MSRLRFVASVLIFVVFATMAMRSAVFAEDSADTSHFTYVRLYCTPDGESHFQNVTVQLRKMNFAPPASPINIGGNSAAASAFFAGFDQHWLLRIYRSVSITPHRQCSFSQCCGETSQ